MAQKQIRIFTIEGTKALSVDDLVLDVVKVGKWYGIYANDWLQHTLTSAVETYDTLRSYGCDVRDLTPDKIYDEGYQHYMKG